MLEVAPERYRFRLLNANDSRFLNMKIRRLLNGEIKQYQELPFFQIGAEQSLLPQVVMIQSGYATKLVPGNPIPQKKRNMDRGTFPDEQGLLMGPAERADVIVDFTGLPDGSTWLVLNTAPDAPFGGFPDVPADPATTGQVMLFKVNHALANPDGDPSTPVNMLVLEKPEPLPPGVDLTRDLALLEEESALICVFIDATTGEITQDTTAVPPDCDPVTGSIPFGPKAAVLGTSGATGGVAQLWDEPVHQNPALGSTEVWELWNWSADAHPIHVHLVKFEVINREVIGGATRQPEPWETGWKDTVIAYPGEVTRIRARFDIEGLYVWHCHILSHEDNEMMVPFCVGDPANCPL
jgi:FtsP/CotA-like multicopper oxidase with cupredoxin domain